MKTQTSKTNRTKGSEKPRGFGGRVWSEKLGCYVYWCNSARRYVTVPE